MIGRRNSGSVGQVLELLFESGERLTECSTVFERHSAYHAVDQGSSEKRAKNRGNEGREICQSDCCDREVIGRR